MKTDYSTVTETPGINASKEQIERLYQRYTFAKNYCDKKDVLEVACGAGQGLGYLARTARTVVGGDIDSKNLDFAKQYYSSRDIVAIQQLNAEHLPFPDNSFDVVICFEAIYYFESVEQFIKESRRVLKEHGKLIICTVNKDWDDFNPSPFSKVYCSVPELDSLLKTQFEQTQFFGAQSTRTENVTQHIISLIKRAAVSMHLIPKTMKGKELLKKVFFGSLIPLPNEITPELSNYTEPVEIAPSSGTKEYKVVFAIANG